MKVRFVSMLVTLAVLTGNLACQAVAEDARGPSVSKASIFLPFDFYTRHREELGLSPEQAREVERLAKELREPAQKLESDRARRTKALLEAAGKTPVNIEEAMGHLKAVLDVENEAKALQFRSGIAIRNALSADQLRKLELLATQEGAVWASGARVALDERIQQLRAEIHKRSGGDPSAAVLGQLKGIEQTARRGRFGEAKAQLEELLKQLRQEPGAASPPTANAPAAPTELPR